MKIRPLADLVFPTPEKPGAARVQAAAAELSADGAALRSAQFGKQVEAALEEARRLADAEAERRRGADAKASTYLAVVAALIPIIVSVATAVWDKKAGELPSWVNLLGLCVAVVYTAMAGLWSFKALEVAVGNRVDLRDITEAWKRRDPRIKLVRELIWSARLNRSGVNRKVTCIKLTHAFLLRAFMVFAGLLLLNLAWGAGRTLTGRQPVSARAADSKSPAGPAVQDLEGSIACAEVQSCTGRAVPLRSLDVQRIGDLVLSTTPPKERLFCGSACSPAADSLRQ